MFIYLSQNKGQNESNRSLVIFITQVLIFVCVISHKYRSKQTNKNKQKYKIFI